MSLRWKIAQFFESIWWRWYLHGKEPVVYLNWKRNYWADFKKRFGIEIKEGTRILDAGCGPAGIFISLTGHQVTAVDPLLSKYRRLPHFQVVNTANILFLESTLEELESPHEYDVVFCLNVINHVADMNRSLKKLRDVMKERGVLYLSVDAHRSGFVRNLFQQIQGDILHPHQFTLPDYVQLIENQGFTVMNSQLVKKEWISSYHLITAMK